MVRILNRCLDTKAKLSLRLTCRTTNEWVTTRDFASKIKVPLTSDNDLYYWILKHEDNSGNPDFIGWCSFVFINDMQFYDNDLLAMFFEAFKHQIEKLELLQCRADEVVVWELLSGIKELDSLTIQQLEFNGCDKIRLPQINIKKLCIHQVAFWELSELKNWDHVIKCLFLHADYITIPKPQFDNPNSTDMSFPQIKTAQLGQIVLPILNFLEDHEGSKGRRIILDVQHLFPIRFGALVERCSAINRLGGDIYFDNVNDKHVKYVFIMSGDDYEDNFLSRILSIKEKIDDRRPLNMWTHVEDMYIRTSRCDIRAFYDEEGVRERIFPKLKNLCIVFDSSSREDPDFLALNRVINLLLEVQRKSVETLVLKWPNYGHDTPINIIDVIEVMNNFPSLNKFVAIAEGVEKVFI